MTKPIQQAHTCAACDHLAAGKFCGYLIYGCTEQVRKPWVFMNEDKREWYTDPPTCQGLKCKKWSGERAYHELNDDEHGTES